MKGIGAISLGNAHGSNDLRSIYREILSPKMVATKRSESIIQARPGMNPRRRAKSASFLQGGSLFTPQCRCSQGDHFPNRGGFHRSDGRPRGRSD